MGHRERPCTKRKQVLAEVLPEQIWPEYPPSCRIVEGNNASTAYEELHDLPRKLGTVERTGTIRY
jgi:hypothetical protein